MTQIYEDIGASESPGQRFGQTYPEEAFTFYIYVITQFISSTNTNSIFQRQSESEPKVAKAVRVSKFLFSG